MCGIERTIGLACRKLPLKRGNRRTVEARAVYDTAQTDRAVPRIDDHGPDSRSAKGC
jgi:hypothetical protein